MADQLASISIANGMHSKRAYPVSFRILNEKKEEKIYLENKPSSGVMELCNDSRRPVYFVPAKNNAMAGPDNHHFALKFRPGVLKSNPKTLITHKLIKKGWTLSIGLVSLKNGEIITLPPSKTKESANTHTNGSIDQLEYKLQKEQLLEESTLVMYFLNTNKAFMTPEEQILLPLQDLHMQCDEGTQVTQVELTCNQLANDAQYTNRIPTYNRHFLLTIINHRGNPHMPIHIGFTGFNAVLNDGKSENQLTLRITNLQKKTTQNNGAFTFSHNKHSRMYLYFETDSDNKECALANANQVAGIELDVLLPEQKKDKDDNIPSLVHEPMFQGDTPIWEIYPENGDVVLQPHQTKLNPDNSSLLPDDSCLDIVLSEIITGYPSGTTHLYLRMENIPGYWDHTYAIPILKQPMVFVDRYDVTITIPDNIPSDSIKSDVNKALSKFKITIDETKTTISNISIQEVKRLKQALIGIKANVEVILTNKYIGIGTVNPTQELSVAGNAFFSGNVGIGTTEPKEKLSIYTPPNNFGFSHSDSDVKISSFVGGTEEKAGWFGTKTKHDLHFFTDIEANKPRMTIHKDGNVGIGQPPSPENTLSVEGSAEFSENLKITGIVGIGKEPSTKSKLEIHQEEGINSNGLKITTAENSTALKIGQFGKIAIDSNNYGGRFTLLENGNVGLGYSGPPKKLSVKGDFLFDGYTISSLDNNKWKKILVGNYGAILTFIGTVEDLDNLIYFSVMYNSTRNEFVKVLELSHILNDNSGILNSTKRKKWNSGDISIDNADKNPTLKLKGIDKHTYSLELTLVDKPFAEIEQTKNQDNENQKNIYGRFKSFAF